MAFKTRRQHRYNRLKEEGFLNFEAIALSKIAFKVPYIKGMRKERVRARRDAIGEYKERRLRFSKAEWRAIIRDMYIAKGWFKEGKADVWQMIRANEEKYKARHPDYAPAYGEKKKVKKKRKEEFASKYQAGLRAYEKGRYR